MEVLVLCGAYTGRPICLGGGRQNVHAAVAISEETHVHFQGWSRAMSRTRDPRQAMDWGSCSPRKLESATVSLRQTGREVRRFFFSSNALPASYWPRSTLARCLNIFKSPL
jgi:hypothetical protein